MRKISLTLLAVSVLLLLAACGASSTAQPYTNRQTVTALSAKVAEHYGETSPKITNVTATLTDGPSAVSMNLVALDGHFHKGSLVATHLSFSMLSDGSKVWAIFATDDQYPITHKPVWLDPESDIRL
jgi:ABC-type glycerol-3-phosphate transport system substrate-binding protein